MSCIFYLVKALLWGFHLSLKGRIDSYQVLLPERWRKFPQLLNFNHEKKCLFSVSRQFCFDLPMFLITNLLSIFILTMKLSHRKFYCSQVLSCLLLERTILDVKVLDASWELQSIKSKWLPYFFLSFFSHNEKQTLGGKPLRAL